jgi:hypothetical protein
MSKTSKTDSLIAVNDLSQMVGLTPRRLRQLATEQKIPGGGRDGWPLATNIKALFDLQRTQPAEYHRERTLKLAAQRRRLELQLAREQGDVIPRADIAGAIIRALGQVRPILEARLINEYPAAVAGLDVPQARVYGRRLNDQILSEFAKLSKEFPE